MNTFINAIYLNIKLTIPETVIATARLITVNTPQYCSLPELIPGG